MTRVRQAIRYMNELKHGFDKTLYEIPAETKFLQANGPIAGQYVPFVADDDDDQDYSGLPDLPMVWQPTQEPTPSRWYPARTKGHSRGSLTNPRTRKAVTYSSTYEMNLAYMLCSNKHIINVEDQPSAILINCEDGQKRHTIDYRVTMAATQKLIAIAVRPTWLLDNDGLPYTIDSIDRQCRNGFADGATILTEKEINNDRGWNGKSVLRALKHPVADDISKLRDYASNFHGTVSLYSLMTCVPDPAAAWNAVWCLVFEETLVPVRPDLKLIDAPFVRFNHN